MNKTILAILLLTLAQLFAMPEQTLNAKDKPLQIRFKHIKAFEKVIESQNNNDFEEMAKRLDKLSDVPELNLVEQAYIAQLRGSMCLATDDIKCAVDEFEKTHQLFSDTQHNSGPGTSIALMNVYAMDKRFEDAFRIGNELLEAGLARREHHNVLVQLAGISNMAGNFSQTIRYLDSIPKYADLYLPDTSMYRARAYIGLGNYEQAMTLIDAKLATSPPGLPFKSGLINSKIEAFHGLGALEQAMDFVDSLNESNPQTIYRLKIADLYGEQGDVERMNEIRELLIANYLAGYKNGELIAWQSEGDIIPKLRPAPKFPAKAVHKRLEGWVDLIMDIDTKGRTKNIRITDSSIKRTFDKAAIQAAEKYLFEPRIKNGEAVEYEGYEIRISFQHANSNK